MIGAGFLLRVFSFMFYFALALILLLVVYTLVGYGIRAFLYALGIQTKDHVRWLLSKFKKNKKASIPCEMCEYRGQCEFSYTPSGVTMCRAYWPKGYSGKDFEGYMKYLKLAS